MNAMKRTALAAALIAGAAWGPLAWGYTETDSNLHDSVATAEVTTGSSLDAISGFLSVSVSSDLTRTAQTDLFKIYVSDYNVFSASTVSASFDDTSLFLFDSLGRGVYRNDDTPTSQLSMLPSGLGYAGFGPSENGFYYLGVSIGGAVARDASFADVFTSDDGFYTRVLAGKPGAGPLASWSQTFELAEPGMGYEVRLTGATAAAVPESASVLLFAAGLCAIALHARARGRRGV